MGQLEKLLIGLDDPIEIVRTIKDYVSSRGFTGYAEATAAKMVTHLFTDAGRTWRQAARQNSQGRLIYEALRREMHGPIGGAVYHQIQRNAAIIKSLPFDIASQVTEHVMTESLKGTRASNIAEQIRTFFPETTRAKADLIARTETSKTATALMRARSEGMGVDWYVWRTSHDSRVRPAHQLMDGVLVRWSDPPSPEHLDGEKHTYGHYNCGEIFNCRCYAEPIIDLDLISWPATVYRNGGMQRMTRKQFESIA